MRFFRGLAIGALLLVLVGSILGMACAGAQGEQGPKGDTGATGATGPQGEPGPNMIVAMGTILMDGTIAEGYNVTSCTWSTASHWYELSLTGIDYRVGEYVTIVTPAMEYTSWFISQPGSPLDKLCVGLSDNGLTKQGTFSFVVLKAP